MKLPLLGAPSFQAAHSARRPVRECAGWKHGAPSGPKPHPPTRWVEYPGPLTRQGLRLSKSRIHILHYPIKSLSLSKVERAVFLLILSSHERFDGNSIFSSPHDLGLAAPGATHCACRRGGERQLQLSSPA